MAVATKVSTIYYQDGQTLRFRFHKFQKMAMRAKERFLLLLGGTQSGKTSFGPIWLHREILLRGAGDYLVVTPSYPLLKTKALPEFERYFKHTLKLGEYNKADKVFTFSEAGEVSMFGSVQDDRTQIFFRHAQDPDALESATAKAAWLDECGQGKFKLGSFEAVMRRLSLHMGRVLMTTTPYNLGWLKQKFWDVWEAGKAAVESIRVISFPSIANPSFPKAEYERARRDLPRWKFDMFYRAIFTRPAGMIYDCFDTAVHKVPSFKIPHEWRVYAGFDFGSTNTACVKIAEDIITGTWYVFSEYHNGKISVESHVKNIQASYPPLESYGGAASEGDWRAEFGGAGIPIQKPPITSVEVGIERVFDAIKNRKLFFFDNVVNLLDEVSSYSREVDSDGEPTEKIAEKSTYHLLDALRYIISYLNDNDSGGWGSNPMADYRG